MNEKRSGEEGYITLFLTLIFLIFMMASFTIIEIVHSYVSSSIAEEEVVGAGEDILADYDKVLFERYHLYFLDPREKDKIEEDGMKYLHQNLIDRGIIAQHCQKLVAYEKKYATDANGMYLRAQIREWEKYRLIGQAMESLKNLASVIGEKGVVLNDADRQIAIADKAEEERKRKEAEREKEEKQKQAQQAAEGVPASPSEATTEEKKDPNAVDTKEKADWKEFLKQCKKIAKLGVLVYAVDDISTVSAKEINMKGLPSREKGIPRGSMILDNKLVPSSLKDVRKIFAPKDSVVPAVQKVASMSIDEMYLAAYMNDNFSSYINPMPEMEHQLDYELEYLAVGKKSDVDNLRTMADRILFIRFLVDFAYAFSNPELEEEALVLGEELSLFLGLPASGPIVAKVLIAALSLTEALLDVHQIFQGGKVPVIKDPLTWTTHFYSFIPQLVTKAKVKKGKVNAGYNEYLQLFLLMGKDKVHLYRMMDIMQVNVAAEEEGFRMKDCVFRFRWEADIKCAHIYQQIPMVGADFGDSFHTKVARYNSY